MVLTGLEVLLGEHASELRSARVGVLANQASVTSGLVHIADALAGVGVHIVSLFGPEHGVRGDAPAGAHVPDSFDERIGVPVHSLYGARRTPDFDSLVGIDVMLIDLQDVGARFYTFIWTMANVMSACGKLGIPVWVLDRPNPIAPVGIEGFVLESGLSSFVGMFPLPITHALTIGELAMLFCKRFDVKCDLQVIPMRGWRRDMWYHETGLPWVPPSPNMPDLDTAICYPGTCLLEGTNVSEGRGTAQPFRMISAPWIESDRLVRALEEYDLPGVDIYADTTASASRFPSIECPGVSIKVASIHSYRPFLTGVAIICALRQLHPSAFEFTQPADGGKPFFDLLAGTDKLRHAIESGTSLWDIEAMWRDEADDFARLARSGWLYE